MNNLKKLDDNLKKIINKQNFFFITLIGKDLLHDTHQKIC